MNDRLVKISNKPYTIMSEDKDKSTFSINTRQLLFLAGACAGTAILFYVSGNINGFTKAANSFCNYQIPK